MHLIFDYSNDVATSIMNTLGGKMIIFDDKLSTVCRIGQYQYVEAFLNIGSIPKFRDLGTQLFKIIMAVLLILSTFSKTYKA